MLNGGIGNDTLFASSWNDYLRGDAGVDFFIFAASFGKSLGHRFRRRTGE